MPEALCKSAHVIELLIKLYKDGSSWFKGGLSEMDWRRRDLNKILTECKLVEFSSRDDVKVTLERCVRANPKLRPQKCMILTPWNKAGDVLFLLEPVFTKTADGTKDKTVFYLGAVKKRGTDHKFFGYRYEGPEGGQSHNFYHAQPIRGFDGVSMDYSVEWYPDKYPTFPLNAINDCQLLLTIMLSFQGMNTVKTEASQSKPGIRDHATSLIQRLKPA